MSEKKLTIGEHVDQLENHLRSLPIGWHENGLVIAKGTKAEDFITWWSEHYERIESLKKALGETGLSS